METYTHVLKPNHTHIVFKRSVTNTLTSTNLNTGTNIDTSANTNTYINICVTGHAYPDSNQVQKRPNNRIETLELDYGGGGGEGGERIKKR
jgi:hypothetical protein